MTVGHMGADRHKVERLEVPRDRTLIVVPTRGRGRVGTACIERGRAIVAQGPTELVLCTNKHYYSTFVSMPDRDAGAARVRILPASESMIETFKHCTRLLTDAAEVSTSGLGASTDTLLEVCEAWLREERDDNVTSSPPAARCQAAIRARQYIDEHLDRPLPLADVCQASYSSPRSLEYGFREIFGVSPIAYIRYARLSRVQRELYLAPHRSGKITQLAMKWGFWHLSQFAKDYSHLFGELPSVTLGRASGRVDRSAGDCAEATMRIAVPEPL